MKIFFFKFFLFIICICLSAMEIENIGTCREQNSLLLKLPIELIEMIARFCLLVEEDELIAIKSFKNFSYVILSSFLKVDFIRAKTKEDYINFFSMKLQMSPFCVVAKLKIPLSDKLRMKFRKQFINDQLIKYNIPINLKIIGICNQIRSHKNFLELGMLNLLKLKKNELIKIIAENPSINLDVFYSQRRMTLLMEEAKRGNVDKVEVLLCAGSNPNIQDITGFTALMFAVINEHTDVIKLLVKFGANQNIKNNWGNTPFLRAVNRGNLELVKLLFNSNVDLNMLDANGNTALICAIKRGNLNIARWLIEVGADPNIKGDNAATALEWSRLCAYDDIERLLLSLNN